MHAVAHHNRRLSCRLTQQLPLASVTERPRRTESEAKQYLRCDWPAIRSAASATGCCRRWPFVNAHVVLCALEQNKSELKAQLETSMQIVVCVCVS